MGYTSTQPVLPNTDVPGTSGGGVWDWLGSHLGDLGNYFKDHAGDILKTGGEVASGVLDYQAKQQALAQQKEQFEKQYGLAQNTQASNVASQLNRAPLADKGQYLALNYQGPQTFQPRDYTHGLNQIQGQAQGGAGAQIAANQAASANYKQGAGGVDTSTLKLILSRLNMGQQPQGSGPPGATAQLAMGQAQNQPNGQPTGVPITKPPSVGTSGQSDPYNFPLPANPTLDQVYAAWDKVHPGQKPPAPTSGDLMNFWNEYRKSAGGG